MKLIKLQILLTLFAFLMMSCDNEVVPPASEQEIISNISKTWSCEMTEDGSPYNGFEIIITNNISEDARVNISNFHNTDEIIYAIVSKDLVITIPEQQIGNQIFEGDGDISNDYSRITWNYKIITDEDTVIVTGVSTYSGEI